MNVIPPHVVESGRLPGLSPVHANPMQSGGTFQKHCGIRFMVCIRSRSLAAARNGGQCGYAQKLYGLAIPLLLDLMPMFSLIVRAIKVAIAIQGQLGSSHHQVVDRRKSAGQRGIGGDSGRWSLRLR
jgi:hypothetical protein